MTNLVIGFLLGYLVAEVIHVHLKEVARAAKTKKVTASGARSIVHAQQARKTKARKAR